MEDINKKLRANGVNPVTAKEDEKLRVLYQLYRRSESNLITTKQDMDRLQKEQAQEIKEVESYMDNIRKLSEEREALTQGIEDENEQLKEEMASMKTELTGDIKEITQMLIEEGLDDLADGTPSEAIAYFLVERSRLTNELEAAKNSGNQKIGTSIVNKEQEKSIAKLQTEKDRIDRENRQKQQKIKDLESEVQKLRKDVEKERNAKKNELDRLKQQLQEGNSRGSSPATISGTSDADTSLQLREVKKKLQKELTTMKIRLGMSESEKKTLNQKVKDLTDALQAEKKRKSSYEGTIIKLKAVVDKNRRQVQTLQDEKQKLTDEKRTLDMRIGFLETDVKTLKEKEHQQGSQGPDTASRLEEINRLKEDNHSKSLELESVMVSLENEKKKCQEIGRRLSATEEKWEQLVQKCKEQERDFSNKLEMVSIELNTSKEEIEASHEVMTRLKLESDKQMEESNIENKQLREALQRAREAAAAGRYGDDKAHHDRVTVKELEGMVAELKKDRDVLARELQGLLGKQEENKQTKDWTKTERQEAGEEKRRLMEQLDNSVSKQSKLVEELRAEQKKNADLSYKMDSYQSQLHMVDSSSSQLKDEIRRKSMELVKQYDTTKEDKGKMVLRINDLQRELEDEQTKHERENHEIKWKHDREEKRCRELQAQMDIKNEEISDLRKETARLSVGHTRSEKQLTEETRLKHDVESRNKVLEEEMTKLWNQLKDMMDKLTASESAKQDLEVELEKVTSQMRIRSSEIDRQQATSFATTSTLGRVQQRAQVAERKIPEIQQELDITLLKLQAAEAQLRDMASNKLELQNCRDEINRLKGKLHESKITETMHEKQLEELRDQINSGTQREERLKNEHSDMKHRLLATQSKLFQAEDKSKTEEDMHQLAERGKKSLHEQVIHLQREVSRLQQELMQNSDKLDTSMQKYEDQKSHNKSKLQQARDIFNKHKSVLADSLMKLQDEVNALKAELAREQGARESLSRKHENLLSEHRELLGKNSDTEETAQDLNRNLSTVEYRAKFLERENGTLQDRIDTLSRQRVALEKLVREYRLEKQKEEINKAASLGLSPVTNGFPGSVHSLSSSLTYPITKTPASSGLGTSISNSYISAMESHGQGEGLLVKVNHPLTQLPMGLDYSPGIGTFSNRTDSEIEMENKY